MLHRNHGAYTLIELLVALAVGSIVLLLAAMAFRAARGTISLAERIAEQNDLLRVGLWQSLQDADYWQSAADPRPPFHKGWSRLPRSSSSSAMKRPFAPVAISADPDAKPHATLPLVNPEGFLPHRTRCWSRISSWANQDAFRQEPWSDSSTRNYDTHLLPGWSWRTVHGDYGLVEATLMTDPDRFPDCSSMPTYGSLRFSDQESTYRPLLHRQTFQVLGMAGSAEYTPRGSSLAWHDERGIFDDNKGFPTFDGGLADADQHFNSMHTQKSGIGNAMGFDTYFESGAVDWVSATHPRFLTGSFGLGLRIAATASIADEISSQIPFSALWLSHGDSGQYEGDFTRGGRDASTTRRVPSSVSDAATDFAWLINRFPTTTEWDWRTETISPANGSLSMATTSARYLVFLGGTLSLHRIAIRDAATDEAFDVRFSVTGTTYRGARQHWAFIQRRAGGNRNTAVTLDGWPMAPGGDFYE